MNKKALSVLVPLVTFAGGLGVGTWIFAAAQGVDYVTLREYFLFAAFNVVFLAMILVGLLGYFGHIGVNHNHKAK